MECEREEYDKLIKLIATYTNVFKSEHKFVDHLVKSDVIDNYKLLDHKLIIKHLVINHLHLKPQ